MAMSSQNMSSMNSLPEDDTPITFLSAIHKVQRMQHRQRSARRLEQMEGSRRVSMTRRSTTEQTPLSENEFEAYDGGDMGGAAADTAAASGKYADNGRMVGASIQELPGDFADDYEMTTREALFEICFHKYVSILFLALPVACTANWQHWDDAWIFWLNFLVMIPLAAILGDFTEELALHTNQTIGGLINATFGNAVEIVVGIQALLANEIRVVQASMLGSIFSNLLLVLGSCFFFGGLFYKEQSFNSVAATSNMGLLALSSIALVLPTPFAEYYDIEDEQVLVISRISAIFLMFMYLQLLFFQLHTHTHIFEEGPDDDGEDGDAVEEIARISLPVATLGLLVVTLMVAFFSEYLVASIDGYCESSGISRTFVGLILLPIVGNAVEHISAVTVAMKDKMDLSMGIAVGSCTQISLFVVPIMVLVGWAMDKPMTLNFPQFEIVLYVLSVITVSIVINYPKVNWLEGSLLITTYFLVAVGFWYERVENFR